MTDLAARLLSAHTPPRAALFVLAVAFATIAGAWIFQWAGYLPCDLCLKQRWAYYSGIPIAVVVAYLASAGARTPTMIGFALLAVVFTGSAIFGVYHAGVEWGFWQGPQDCTGTLSRATSMEDFLQRLETTKVVRCDEVALRIFGLSLAGWNAVISVGVVFVSVLSARRAMAKL